MKGVGDAEPPLAMVQFMPGNPVNINLSGRFDLISADIGIIRANVPETPGNITLSRHVRPEKCDWRRFPCKRA